MGVAIPWARPSIEDVKQRRRTHPSSFVASRKVTCRDAVGVVHAWKRGATPPGTCGTCRCGLPPPTGRLPWCVAVSGRWRGLVRARPDVASLQSTAVGVGSRPLQARPRFSHLRGTHRHARDWSHSSSTHTPMARSHSRLNSPSCFTASRRKACRSPGALQAAGMRSPSMRSAHPNAPSSPLPSAWTAYPSFSSLWTSWRVACTEASTSMRARRTAASASIVQPVEVLALVSRPKPSRPFQDRKKAESGCKPRSSPTLLAISCCFSDGFDGSWTNTHSSPCAPTVACSASMGS
eukprot:scaffold670_cov333-Pavlova_lutheri.AAC.28